MESCSIDTKRFTKGLWKNKLGEEVERERRKEKVRDRDRKRERESGVKLEHAKDQ